MHSPRSLRSGGTNAPGSGGHPPFEIRRSLISRSKCFAFALRTRDTPLWRGAGGITYGPRAAFGTFRRVEKYTLHIHIVIMEQGCYLFICGYCFAEISPLRRRVGGFPIAPDTPSVHILLRFWIPFRFYLVKAGFWGLGFRG